MPKTIIGLLHLRLGQDIIINHGEFENECVLKISPTQLLRVIEFLHQDPDTQLKFLETIVCLPQFAPFFPSQKNDNFCCSILYQLKSVRLPYRVTILLEILLGQEVFPSVTHLFAGALWHEKEISEQFGIIFETSSSHELYL